MHVIHISEADAARDLAGLLARVRAGTEVVIENPTSLAVVLRTAEAHPVRRLSESLRLAKEHSSTVKLDGDFAQDLTNVLNSRPEPLRGAWD